MHLLIFQHIAVEHPGVFLDFWKAAGHAWRTVELDAGEPIPPLDDFDLLCVMGGPMDVWQDDLHSWLAPEKAAIRRWVKELGRPFLGICLGHQLLAEALGGKVTPMAQPEVGIIDVELTPVGRSDRLFAGLNSPLKTLQWHGAEISRLPAGAEILAATAACPAQAIRFGRHAYGMQFHTEITASTVAEWERIPEYKASLERTLGAEAAAGLGEAVASRLWDFNEAARQMNDNLSAIVATARAAA
jgi:GMP synthase-like glutamine amidotransferase